MKPLLAILSCILLASCADMVPPRAIIAPERKVESLNVQPVRDASDKLTTATTAAGTAAAEVTRAAEKASATSEDLAIKITRLESFANAEKEISQALRDAIKLAVETSDKLSIENSDLETKTILLGTKLEEVTWTNNALVDVIRTHEIDAAKQAATIETQNADNAKMRADLDSLNSVRDDLVKSEANVTNLEEDKTTMAWWIGGLGLYAFISTVAIIFLLLKVFNPLG